MITGFLTGVIFSLYMVATVFFVKFWTRTGDRLFLAFAVAFVMEGFNRLQFLSVNHPEDGSPGIYIVRILAFSLIAAAVIAKNLQQKR